MDWKELAGDLIRAGAPIVGHALGGPFGGMIGDTIGKIIADALGVEATPDAVADAMRMLPAQQLAEKLRAAEGEAAARWPALAAIAQAETDLGRAQLDATGQTMRAELQLAALASGPWRSAIAILQSMWRPLAMIVWTATWPFQIFAILHLAYAGDGAALNAATSLIYALSVWNAGPAALAGVYAWGRTREKIQGALTRAPGADVTGQAAKTAVRRR